MPNVSNKLYQKVHKKFDQFTHNTAWESMSFASKERLNQLKDNGDVNENGVPMITVIADGALFKRSYRTNFNALSGVVSTKNNKILYLNFYIIFYY